MTSSRQAPARDGDGGLRLPEGEQALGQMAQRSADRRLQREDSALWRYCAAMDIPESLSETIELFRRYGKIASRELDLFGEPSWLAVHIGQMNFPQRVDALAEYRQADGAAWLARFRTAIEGAAESLPGHGEFIVRAGMAAGR